MSTTETETFHLGDVLTVTGDIMVAPNGFGEVHRLIEHLAGYPVWTHQIPRVAEDCKPGLLRQFPRLAEATPPDFAGAGDVAAACMAWVAEVARWAGYGTTVTVRPLPAGTAEQVGPLTELADMLGKRDEA